MSCIPTATALLQEGENYLLLQGSAMPSNNYLLTSTLFIQTMECWLLKGFLFVCFFLNDDSTLQNLQKEHRASFLSSELLLALC